MNLSRFLLRRHFRRIGRMGGQARAAQLREPFKVKARELLHDMHKPVPEVLL